MGNHLKLRIVVWWVMMMAAAAAGTSVTINVGTYGARGDGMTDSTKAFGMAWSAACGSAAAAVTLYVPQGRFLLGSITFEGPCRSPRLVFQVDGTLIAPSDYRVLGSSTAWITFHRVARMSLRGATLDARGRSFWACRASSNNCPPGAKSIAFSWCNNVVVSNLTSLNSQMKHMTINQSNNMMFNRLTIRAPSSSPNTDGIYVQSSSSIIIRASTIGTGDDCIAIGQGSRNILIEKINCGPGHGISIGSLGGSTDEIGVQNVTVRASTFTKTQNGVRIKSWNKRSNGFATNVRFQNLIMRNVDNPINIDQEYCPSRVGCPHEGSGVKISQVTYENIFGTSATKVSVNLNCTPSRPCRGIKLRNIKLTYNNTFSDSVCANARGTVSGVLNPRSCLSKD